jgi:hypothetical protein
VSSESAPQKVLDDKNLKEEAEKAKRQFIDDLNKIKL